MHRPPHLLGHLQADLDQPDRRRVRLVQQRRDQAGRRSPTVCAETRVGRLRYLDLLLYDADRVGEAGVTLDDQDLVQAQRGVFLDPHEPEVIATARESGIPEDWRDAARRPPVYDLVSRHKVALPLHPEYRTLPMVWYVPPLSPVLDAVIVPVGYLARPYLVYRRRAVAR